MPISKYFYERKAHAWVFARRLWPQFINGTTNECKKLRHINHIKRCNHKDNQLNAIFLVRNPWNAFFSEFQRATFVEIWKGTKNDHVYNMLLTEFDVKSFEKKLFDFSQKYIEILLIYEQFKKMNRTVFLITFENLQYEIVNIVKFLITDEYFEQHSMEYQHRIRCIQQSVDLLRTQHIKRPNIMDLNNSDMYLTREVAYSQVGESTICKIWHTLHPYIVKFDLMRFGYGHLVEKYNCKQYVFENVSHVYQWNKVQ